MNKALLFAILTILFINPVLSQQSSDTITVMHYNITNYRNTTSYCTGTNNPSDVKEDGIKLIVQHKNPDIICFNEVGNSLNNLSKLLDNSLNVDGETKYLYTDYQATSSTDLMNVIYYNTEVLELYSKDAITDNLDNTSIVRLIDVTTFYHLDPSLSETLDTNFLTVFTAHLKAGSSSSDEAKRAQATAAIMDYIANHEEIEDFILTGDLNTYSGNDDEFQNLVTGNTASTRFYDPMDMIGNWNNSASYSYVHTQSTRSSSNGCYSSGGMDDRFDFILVSKSVKNDEDRIGYIDGSYEALGQDGNRFNGSINSPTNNSESADIIDALYNVSDHLPVFLDLKFTYSAPVGTKDIYNENLIVKVKQPIDENLSLKVSGANGENSSVTIYNILGQKVWNKEDVSFNNNSWVNLSVDNLPQGVLIVQIQLSNGLSKTLKVVKS